MHRSPEAEKMRGEIARMVDGGKSEGEIVEFYVGKYGERILREPRGQRAVWLAVAPVVFVIAGLMVLLLFLRKQMTAKGAEA